MRLVPPDPPHGREPGDVLPVALVDQPLGRNEPQCRRVDTITPPGWQGPIVEHVPEMGIGVSRSDFDALRPQAAVPFLADVPRFKRLREARPPRARVELVERAEERLAGDDIHLDARPGRVPAPVPESQPRPLALRDFLLL